MADTQKDEKDLEKFLARHHSLFMQASAHLAEMELAQRGTDGQQHIETGVRLLIDLALRGYSTHMIARQFLSMLLLMPAEHRVAFTLSVANFCKGYVDEEAEGEWKAFRKKLLAASGKVALLAMELDAAFADWPIQDKAQQDLFRKARLNALQAEQARWKAQQAKPAFTDEELAEATRRDSTVSAE